MVLHHLKAARKDRSPCTTTAMTPPTSNPRLSTSQGLCHWGVQPSHNSWPGVPSFFIEKCRYGYGLNSAPCVISLLESFLVQGILGNADVAGQPWCPIKMRVFRQNESCLLALSLLHNLREDGGKQGSSHFDEKLSF